MQKERIVAAYIHSDCMSPNIIFYSDRNVFMEDLQEMANEHRAEDTYQCPTDEEIKHFVNNVGSIEEYFCIFSNGSIEKGVTAVLVPQNYRFLNLESKAVNKWAYSYKFDDDIAIVMLFENLNDAKKALIADVNAHSFVDSNTDAPLTFASYENFQKESQKIEQGTKHQFKLLHTNRVFHTNGNFKIKSKDGFEIEISEVYAKEYPNDKGEIQPILGVSRGDGELISFEDWDLVYVDVPNGQWEAANSFKL